MEQEASLFHSELQFSSFGSAITLTLKFPTTFCSLLALEMAVNGTAAPVTPTNLSYQTSAFKVRSQLLADHF